MPKISPPLNHESHDCSHYSDSYAQQTEATDCNAMRDEVISRAEVAAREGASTEAMHDGALIESNWELPLRLSLGCDNHLPQLPRGTFPRTKVA